MSLELVTSKSFFTLKNIFDKFSNYKHRSRGIKFENISFSTRSHCFEVISFDPFEISNLNSRRYSNIRNSNIPKGIIIVFQLIILLSLPSKRVQFTFSKFGLLGQNLNFGQPCPW